MSVKDFLDWVKYKPRSVIKRLQAAVMANGVDLRNWGVDGYFGEETKQAFLSLSDEAQRDIIHAMTDSTQNGDPDSWIEIAKSFIGLHEIKGEEDQPEIVEFHRVALGNWVLSQEDIDSTIPWCASFVTYVMKQAGYEPPANPARAKSWRNFGKQVDEPVYGAIMVKSRKGGGHVGFVVGVERDFQGNITHLKILGGNQEDQVKVSRYRMSDDFTFHVPLNYIEKPFPDEPLRAEDAGKES